MVGGTVTTPVLGSRLGAVDPGCGVGLTTPVMLTVPPGPVVAD